MELRLRVSKYAGNAHDIFFSSFATLVGKRVHQVRIGNITKPRTICGMRKVV